MDCNSSYRKRQQAAWGLVLIVVGGVALLDRWYLLELYELWHYWPFVFVLFGINKMIGCERPQHLLSGASTVLFGLWLYASIEGLWGLSFFNSWPLLIIIWGVRIMLEPFLAPRAPSIKENHYEK